MTQEPVTGAIGALVEEHRVIERVLDCLEQMAIRFEAENRISCESAERAMQFLRLYADERHHGKEEGSLFPALEKRGFPADRGPTVMMRRQHAEGRQLTAAMRAAIEAQNQGDPGAAAVFAKHARAFVSLLREHIRREDLCLFQIASRMLTPEDQADLAREFGAAAAREAASGLDAECSRIAAELPLEYPIPEDWPRPEIRIDTDSCDANW